MHLLELKFLVSKCSEEVVVQEKGFLSSAVHLPTQEVLHTISATMAEFELCGEQHHVAPLD